MCEVNQRCYNGLARGPFGMKGYCTACEDGRKLIEAEKHKREFVEQDRLLKIKETLQQQQETIPPYYHGGCF